MKTIYAGGFVTTPITGKLEKQVENQHITFAFGAAAQNLIPKNLMGKTYEVIVSGYGRDNNNEGVKVELPIELRDIYLNTGVPHITISISKIGKPIDTRKLKFSDTQHQTIKIQLGYFTDRGVVLNS